MRALSLIALIALAACAAAGGVRVYKVYVEPFYSLVEARVFAAAGGPVEIYGAPRGGAGPEEVAAALRLPPHLFPSELTATQNAGGGLRLALVFAPANAVTPEAVCAGEAQGREAGTPLIVYGVFCTGTRRVISEGVLEAPTSPSPGDPAFAQAFTTLFYEIFPSTAPFDRDSCRVPRNC